MSRSVGGFMIGNGLIAVQTYNGYDQVYELSVDISSQSYNIVVDELPFANKIYGTKQVLCCGVDNKVSFFI